MISRNAALAAVRDEIDVARPVAVLPGYRAIGFHHASNKDVAWLWHEAQGYFERSASEADEQAAERLRRLGTQFAVMAVSLLQEIGRAAQQIDHPLEMADRA